MCFDRVSIMRASALIRSFHRTFFGRSYRRVAGYRALSFLAPYSLRARGNWQLPWNRAGRVSYGIATSGLQLNDLTAARPAARPAASPNKAPDGMTFEERL
ncbi:hypothetical protein MAP00_007455 [Monascus purpureus]|nr:hypothetical protein MAP00_007455 [Monascus purpureus]